MSLQANVEWKDQLKFMVQVRSHSQIMDAKKESGGTDQGPNPKEYFLAGLCGCTAMDVVSLMKKYKLDFASCNVSAEAETTKEHPMVFSSVLVTFDIVGMDLDLELVKKAVTLSMTKYCGVSAMLSKAVPVKYEVVVNTESVLEGFAKFN
jgi:putative redox protein